MTGYDDIDANRVKHLELIQAVVSRLGTDSFLVKGWAATLTSAFVGFGITKSDWGLALAGVAPASVFWILDAYFLHAERLFRALYDAVRTGKHDDLGVFYMSATSAEFRKKADKGWA